MDITGRCCRQFLKKENASLDGERSFAVASYSLIFNVCVKWVYRETFSSRHDYLSR